MAGVYEVDKHWRYSVAMDRPAFFCVSCVGGNVFVFCKKGIHRSGLDPCVSDVVGVSKVVLPVLGPAVRWQ